MERYIPKYSVYLWGDHLLYVGGLDGIAEHRHHALQLTLNRKGHFGLRIGESLIKCGGAIIGANRRHQLLTPNDSQIHLLIDHQTSIARTIARQHLGKKNFKILSGDLLKRLRGCIDAPGNSLGSCAQAHAVYGKLVSELGGDAERSADAIDPRIRAVMNLLNENLLVQTLTIRKLARHVCLSESRLMHLFSEQIGIPLRRYNLWLRVITAERFIAQGKMSFTEAAHSAGFADSAHLCRAYKSMFGMHLSDCVKNSRFVQVISCFS